MAPAADWHQVEFLIDRDDIEAAELLLAELGALSVSLADPGGEAILEPAPGETPLWTRIAVSALLPTTVSPQDIRARLAGLPGAAGALIRVEGLAERDWIREFRERLVPQCFGGRLWICPPGSACPEPDAAMIVLEPGLAFGSGSHPTTAMCLDWLAGLDLDGLRVLDWGCGSGVLAIAALKLGAASALAIDIDPQALLATATNARDNDVGARLQIAEPAEVDALERFDIVVANILAGTLVELAPTLAGRCRSGARVALSGILATQAQQVIADCGPWLNLHPAVTRADWALLSGTRATDRRSRPAG